MEWEYFDSMNEILQRCEEPTRGGSASRKPPDSSWDAGIGYEGAIKMYEEGWYEGTQLVSDLLSEIYTRPAKGNKIAWCRAQSGPIWDVGAYLAGDPECALSMYYRRGSGARYLTLYVPISYNCGVTSDTALARLAAVLALVDSLESLNIRCKIIAYESAQDKWSGTGKKYGFQIKLKDFADPLHLINTAFPVGHPAFFRRIVFALNERSRMDVCVEMTHSNYGSSIDVTAEELEADTDAVVFPVVRFNETNAEAHLLTLMMNLPEDVRDLIEKRESC